MTFLRTFYDFYRFGRNEFDKLGADFKIFAFLLIQVDNKCKR